jgi:hypothetical protein
MSVVPEFLIQSFPGTPAKQKLYFRFEHLSAKKLFSIPLNFIFYRGKKNITFLDANRIQTPINTHFLKIKKYYISTCVNFTLQVPNVKKLAFWIFAYYLRYVFLTLLFIKIIHHEKVYISQINRSNHGIADRDRSGVQ